MQMRGGERPIRVAWCMRGAVTYMHIVFRNRLAMVAVVRIRDIKNMHMLILLPFLGQQLDYALTLVFECTCSLHWLLLVLCQSLICSKHQKQNLYSETARRERPTKKMCFPHMEILCE